MTGVTGTNNAGYFFGQLGLPAPQAPADVAKAMVAAHSEPNGRINFAGLKHALDALVLENPALAAQVTDALRTELGASAFTRMQNTTYSIRAADGKGIGISENAPSLQSYFDGTANQSKAKTHADRAAMRQSDLAFYARLDRLWGDGNARTFDGEKINAGINDLIKSGMSLDQYEQVQASRATAALNQASSANQELLWDLGQMTLDIVGIFDPTGLSDGANALISAGRGDWIGAGLSALAIVPVVGALATAGKLGKWAETITKAVEAAANNPAARQLLEPALTKLHNAINAIPDSVMRKLPDELRTTLEGIKTKLDGLFGVINSAINRAAERLGLPVEEVREIVDLGPGNRPDPSSYLPPSRFAEHAKAFENGGSRYALQSSLDKYGLAREDGTTFIIPKADADAIWQSTGGDPRKLENALGLPVGQLDGDSLVRVDFAPSALKDLKARIPSGNEKGANEQWLPGGFLASGVNEATIDVAKATVGQFTSKVVLSYEPKIFR